MMLKMMAMVLLLLIPSSLQEFYQTGVIVCPASVSVQELREACDYLLVPFSEKTVQTPNLCEWRELYLSVCVCGVCVCVCGMCASTCL